MKRFKNLEGLFGLSTINAQMPPRAEFEHMVRAHREQH